MITWIFAVLVLYFFNLMLVSYLRYGHSGLSKQEMIKVGLGPRDSAPELGVLGGRADRALTNLKESLPIFLTIALLSIATGKVNPLAINGAILFTVARFAYLPTYMAGVFAVRSIIWTLAIVGLVLMAVSLF